VPGTPLFCGALPRRCYVLTNHVHQWRQPLNPHLKPVAALNGADAAGCAGENHIAGSSVMFVEMKLTSSAGLKMSCFVFEFAATAVLEKLDGQFTRINFCFHIGAERCERVERFAPRPLAFGILDGAVADVLRGGIAENIA